MKIFLSQNKKYPLLFILLFSFIISNSQVFQSSCIASKEISMIYKSDADELALQVVYKLNDTYKDSVKIKPDLSFKYLSAILAVYNSTNHPARDTVFDLINIHALHIRDMNHLYVSADSNQTWMKNFRNNIIPTGNSQIDNLMSKYYLRKVAYVDYAGILPNHSVGFETDTNCNIVALASLFFGVPGYNSAGENQGVLDGNTIYDSIANNFTQLIFRHGWNDCWNGCINNRYWKFRVYNDCSVEYFGSFGDALPPGVGLDKAKSIFKNVLAYPNPVKEKLTIEIKSIEKAKTKLSISNSYGQLVYSLNELSQKQDIDIEFLPSGIYFLRLQNDSDQQTFKFIKE